ncbi:altronate dehydratase, partial [Parabacteroides distasonis]
RTNKPLKTLVIQEEGGSLSTIEKAVRYAREMASDAGLMRKMLFPIDRLIVGTECGGSDPTSGIAANPVIGEMADRLVEMGAAVILSETTEFIGAEHILAKRAADQETRERIYSIIGR